MANKKGEQDWQTAAKIAKLKQIAGGDMVRASKEFYDKENGKVCERCEKSVSELYMCEKCELNICDDCFASYNQFTQIDFDCCRRCANSAENDF